MSEKRYERVFLNTNEFIIFDKQEEHRDKGSLYLSENNILKLLNEQDNEIKQLETRCQHHEHNLKQYQKEKENLTNMIKNQINEINYQEYLSDHDKILAIHQLKWVLSIINSGTCKSYPEKEVVHFGKTIDEICSHVYPSEKK